MSNQTQQPSDLGMKLVYWLTVAMVIVGLINMTPGIPGYDDLAESLTGINGFTFRKFPFEWFYPSFFALMMLIVAERALVPLGTVHGGDRVVHSDLADGLAVAIDKDGRA